MGYMGNIRTQKRGNPDVFMSRQSNHCARKLLTMKKICCCYASGRLGLECFFLQPHCAFVYTEKLALPKLYAVLLIRQKRWPLTRSTLMARELLLTKRQS